MDADIISLAFIQCNTLTLLQERKMIGDTPEHTEFFELLMKNGIYPVAMETTEGRVFGYHIDNEGNAVGSFTMLPEMKPRLSIEEKFDYLSDWCNQIVIPCAANGSDAMPFNDYLRRTIANPITLN